jgi:hypothetical protein
MNFNQNELVNIVEQELDYNSSESDDNEEFDTRFYRNPFNALSNDEIFEIQYLQNLTTNS